MKRRQFIRQLGATGLLVGGGIRPVFAWNTSDTVSLTILHTNDWHSRIDPFPQDGGRNAGMGGATRRARKVAELRRELEHVLLLDAGDVFQGTPYFNLYGGELEFKLMTAMHYDAATIGNHDFDGGIENLARQFDEHAGFSLLNCNYRLENTPLAGKVRPHQVIRKGPLRIGLLGVGIELDGLVPSALTGDARYTDPVAAADKAALYLKEEENCDLVICLSHLGYRYREEKISDLILAAQTRHLDVILGGHTHTFLDEPTIVKNRADRGVLVHQVGWAGILLGRIDVTFDRRRGKKCFRCANEWLNS